MKKLSVVLVVMLLAGCSAMGTSGASDSDSARQKQDDQFHSYIGGSK
jgi:uncharacterized protein YceK